MDKTLKPVARVTKKRELILSILVLNLQVDFVDAFTSSAKILIAKWSQVLVLLRLVEIKSDNSSFQIICSD